MILAVTIYIINYIFNRFREWLFKRIDSENEKWRFLLISIAVFASYLLIALIPMGTISDALFPDDALTAKQLLVCFYIFIGTILMYIFFNIFDFIKHSCPDVKTENSFNYRSSLYIHIFCVATSILSFLIFYILNRQSALGIVNPIIVSIMLSSLVILMLELFFTAQLLIIEMSDARSHKIKLYKFLVICATLFFFSAYFFFSSNDSLIRTERISNFNRQDYERPTVEDYFDGWYQQRLKENGSDSVKVFLISGQGGGSRAATWFLGNMMKFEEKVPSFYNNIFSISTVSGSSSGAAMYLAIKNLDASHVPKDRSIPNVTKGEKLKGLISDIYSRNYLSSGVFGLLLNDFTLDYGTNMLLDENRDRNYSLQKEEMTNFEKAYYRYHNIEENGPKMLKSDIHAFFEKDYMHMYNDQSALYKHPLFLINTTLLSGGSKGLFSPVLLGSTARSEDVYGNFRNCTHSDYKALPLITCVNQSQAFPFLNSYNFLHGSGRLGDGGMWENTGTETTLLIYQKLKAHILKNNYKAALYIITLNNGKIKENSDPSYTKPSILNTFSALTKSPFYGREYLSFQAIKLAVPAKNHIQSAPKDNYTLTRFLNKRHIDSIMVEINNSNSNSTSNAANAIEGILQHRASRKGRIYIQYKNLPEAKKLEANLKGLKSVDIKPMEKIESSISRNNIRFFHKADSTLASGVASLINRNTAVSDRYIVQDFSGRYKYVPEGQIEIWIK